MRIAGPANLTLGLILSLSKDEAAARPVGRLVLRQAQDEAKAVVYG